MLGGGGGKAQHDVANSCVPGGQLVFVLGVFFFYFLKSRLELSVGVLGASQSELKLLILFPATVSLGQSMMVI